MACANQAPSFLAHVNKRQVPSRCLAVSVTMMLVGVLLNYLVPSEIFAYAMTGVLALLIWTWGTIVVSHLGYRRAVQAGAKPAVGFRLPGAPATNWIVLAFLGAVIVVMALDPGMRIAFYGASVWFAALAAIYLVRKSISSRGQ